MTKIYCFLVLGLLVCAGCVETKAPIYYSSTFSLAQAERMMRPGRNTIIVNCFTRNPNDDSISTCAGVVAEIIPATERAAEFSKVIFGSATGGKRTVDEVRETLKRIANADANFGNLRADATCDSNGFAVFNKVADGEFYVLAGAGGMSYAGKISVSGGETKQIVLSGSSPTYDKGFNYDHWYKYERRREWESRKHKK